MASKYKQFDRGNLQLLPLKKRVHNLDLSIVKDLEQVKLIDDSLSIVAAKMSAAKKRNSSVVMLLGAHVIRSGVQRYLIDLIEKKQVFCLAVNGAFAIHDFEFAKIAATTESVERYIRDGRFGLWSEIGALNEIAIAAHEGGFGFGEQIGKYIEENNFAYKEMSVLAAAYRADIPVTVHVGIGSDIVHEHPNCDGAAIGGASYTDFLIFTQILTQLSGGVVMTFGSAVMAPEVFLKALAMARNVAHQRGETITDFTTLVCDLRKLPATYRDEASKSNPDYYFRPWKTMLVRTQPQEKGSYYVQGDHKDTIPGIWSCLQHIRE